MGFEHLLGMGFVLEGQGLGSDEGSFGALQSLLEPPVYMPGEVTICSQGGTTISSHWGCCVGRPGLPEVEHCSWVGGADLP